MGDNSPYTSTAGVQRRGGLLAQEHQDAALPEDAEGGCVDSDTGEYYTVGEALDHIGEPGATHQIRVCPACLTSECMRCTSTVTRIDTIRCGARRLWELPCADAVLLRVRMGGGRHRDDAALLPGPSGVHHLLPSSVNQCFHLPVEASTGTWPALSQARLVKGSVNRHIGCCA